MDTGEMDQSVVIIGAGDCIQVWGENLMKIKFDKLRHWRIIDSNRIGA
jgi:hypothetical protein